MTLDNALKLLVVKSPNDVAVTVAEGISGSVEAFVDDMNAAGGAARRLKELHFVNPTGLPDNRQVTSARDMAMIGRALLKEFPEHHDLFGIGALRLGDRVIPTRNSLIGRYAGADGMRTGFTCAAGFECRGERHPRRPTSDCRGSRFIVGERTNGPGFGAARPRVLPKRTGRFGLLDALPSCGAKTAPDMRAEVCSPKDDKEAMSAVEADEWLAPLIPTAPEAALRRRIDLFPPPRPRSVPSPRACLDATQSIVRSRPRCSSVRSPAGPARSPIPGARGRPPRRYRARRRPRSDAAALALPAGAFSVIEKAARRRQRAVARLPITAIAAPLRLRTAIAVACHRDRAAGQRRQDRRARLRARSAIEWPGAIAGTGRVFTIPGDCEFGDPPQFHPRQRVGGCRVFPPMSC